MYLKKKQNIHPDFKFISYLFNTQYVPGTMLEPEFTRGDMASGSLAFEKLAISGKKHIVLFSKLHGKC